MATPRYQRPGQTDLNGRQLFWPNQYVPAPFVEDPGPLTVDEAAQVRVSYDAQYDYFTLPADRERYLAVMNMVANGVYFLTSEKQVPDPADPKVIHCHVWWLMPYSDAPNRRY